MSNKIVMVEMTEDTAAWLQLNPALGNIRIIGEFIPAVAAMGKPAPLKITPDKRGNGEHKKQEFPRGTKVKMQHRPPADAAVRRKGWDHLKDKFGDMTIGAKDARDSLKALGIKGASSMVTIMMRLRELKPVAEKG